jgi:integrase/recombinase XerD
VGKGLKSRKVKFTTECGERIKEYLATRTDDSPYLFVSRLGKPYTRQGIWKMLKRYGIELGIDEKLTPHALRRTFATQLSDRNMKFQNIAKLMGIENLNVLRHYVETSEKKILSEFRDKN